MARRNRRRSTPHKTVQIFNGDVGNVGGRDVLTEVTAPPARRRVPTPRKATPLTLASAAEIDALETAERIKFFEETGIDCGPKTRATLKWLQTKNFSKFHLRLAWEREVIYAKQGIDELLVRAGWREKAALSLVIFFLLLLVYVSWVVNSERWITANHNLAAQCVIWAVVLIFGLWAYNKVLIPIYTAMNAQETLAERDGNVVQIKGGFMNLAIGSITRRN